MKSGIIGSPSAPSIESQRSEAPEVGKTEVNGKDVKVSFSGPQSSPPPPDSPLDQSGIGDAPLPIVNQQAQTLVAHQNQDAQALDEDEEEVQPRRTSEPAAQPPSLRGRVEPTPVGSPSYGRALTLASSQVLGVGAGVATGVLVGAIAGASIGAVAGPVGVVVGAAIGSVVGWAVQRRLFGSTDIQAKSKRAEAGLHYRGLMTPDVKKGWQKTSWDQKVKLLHVPRSEVADKAGRQALRQATMLAAARHDFDTAMALRKSLKVSKKEVPDKQDRKRVQDAVHDMAGRRGLVPASNFKRELVRMAREDRLPDLDAEMLVTRRIIDPLLPQVKINDCLDARKNPELHSAFGYWARRVNFTGNELEYCERAAGLLKQDGERFEKNFDDVYNEYVKGDCTSINIDFHLRQQFDQACNDQSTTIDQKKQLLQLAIDHYKTMWDNQLRGDGGFAEHMGRDFDPSDFPPVGGDVLRSPD